MQRQSRLFFNIAFSLNCLLIFLLIFESRLVLPQWLQVIGRTHPMLLHFPIVLMILYGVLLLFVNRRNASDDVFDRVRDITILLTAVTSALTAIAGLFLSREQGYDPETLQWHKWGGVSVSLLAMLLYYFRRRLEGQRAAAFTGAIVSILLIIFTGHQGAGITHGQNFLLAPMMPEQKKRSVPIDQALVYADMVAPILQSKCMSCHNNKKAKGELIMETEALLRKGGKSGLLWDSTAADLGLLLRRIHLPLEEKKHMPPQGKPQLTAEESNILALWIRRGANFKLRVLELPAGDTLRDISIATLGGASPTEYDFPAADQSVIEKLNTVNRVVTAESLNSPALNVSFFNSQLYKPGQLQELAPIRKQIVTLDLSKMPITDADVPGIGEMEHLRVLNLSFSGISGASLSALKNLKNLQELSISGVKASAEQIRQLAALPRLKSLYIWNIPITAADLQQVKQAMKTVRLETGFRADTIVLKLAPPVLQNEQVIFTGPLKLQLKQYINGATIRYTLDGSEPDSIHSPIFDGHTTLDAGATIKAKTYKQGWITSDVFETHLYRSGYRPDTVIYTTKPDPGYKGKANTLIDLSKGDFNYRNGEWVAWRNEKMEALLEFPSRISVKSVMLSSLMDVGAYILPPYTIEIRGGDSPDKLTLLGRSQPSQPSKIEPAVMRGFETKLTPSEVKYLKVIVTPLAKLPRWHPGKGDKAWFFVDEILVN